MPTSRVGSLSFCNYLEEKLIERQKKKNIQEQQETKSPRKLVSKCSKKKERKTNKHLLP
jgi:hypothetical protein